MADPDFTITQTGLYEQPLTGGRVYLIAIPRRYPWSTERIEILNHGTDPIYIRFGTTTSLRDPQARILTGGNGIDALDLPHLDTAQLAIISASDTTISIART